MSVIFDEKAFQQFSPVLYRGVVENGQFPFVFRAGSDSKEGEAVREKDSITVSLGARKIPSVGVGDQNESAVTRSSAKERYEAVPRQFHSALIALDVEFREAYSY